MADKDSTEKMLREAYRLRRVEDIDGAVATFTDDAMFRVVGSSALAPLTEAARGHAALRAVFTQLARDWDWKDYDVDSVLVDGDRAVVHSRGRMRYVPKNVTVETETLDLITVRDGKIAEFLQFCDTHAAAALFSGPS